MARKATIIKPDVLVFVVDMKTGKVSVNGRPFRDANFIARKLEPHELEGGRGGGTSGGEGDKGGGETGGSGGGTGGSGGGTGSSGGGPLPIDEIICASTAGNPQCRKFYRTSGGGEWIETPWICSAPCPEIVS